MHASPASHMDNSSKGFPCAHQFVLRGIPSLSKSFHSSEGILEPVELEASLSFSFPKTLPRPPPNQSAACQPAPNWFRPPTTPPTPEVESVGRIRGSNPWVGSPPDFQDLPANELDLRNIRKPWFPTPMSFEFLWVSCRRST